MPNICAVCGQELTLTAMEDMDDNAERTYKLSCGHLYLFFTAKVIYYNHSHIRELHIFVYDVFLFSGDYFNFIIEIMFEYRSSVAV